MYLFIVGNKNILLKKLVLNTKLWCNTKKLLNITKTI